MRYGKNKNKQANDIVWRSQLDNTHDKHIEKSWIITQTTSSNSRL